ncbi:hypothetical protein HNQ50_003663 [Silvimonas terrae]|uniref:DUF4350 domain-containing protein n=1 Tax=Silvimonas terrae TaxID=300266 RepID=A0A840RH05_9NEIS|nr:DUF4350 domain-containing protein [Silvimonas terrae]MBB5192909.1 hypothetical protein [Silvimonas terrae]
MMDRRTLFVLALVGAVLGLGTWWFLTNMHEVTQQVRAPQGAAAQNNRWLAAGTLLQRTGLTVRYVEDATLAMPAAHDVLIVPVEDESVTVEVFNQQMNWLRLQGGTLILGVQGNEFVYRSLLRDAGITLSSSKQPTQDAPTLAGSVLPPGKVDRAQLQLKGLDYPLSLTRLPAKSLHVEHNAMVIGSDGPDGQTMIMQTRNSVFAFVASGQLFSNSLLNQEDHAELLWRLMYANGQPGTIWIVTGGRAPPWYVLLWRNLPGTLILSALALILLIVRSLPRFGPLAPEVQTVRRGLVEHLAASGRWLFRHDEANLIAACQASLRAALKRHQPRLALLPTPRLATMLARLSGKDEKDIALALSQGAGHDPRAFTQCIALLQSLTLMIENPAGPAYDHAD